jgi:uncharacterized protein
MRVVVFGGRGTIGSRVTAELVRRGHTVRVVDRAGSTARPLIPGTAGVAAEVANPSSVAEAVRGADAVVSAIGPAEGQEPTVILSAARALISGLKRAGVPRLVVIGGAGSLEVRPGVRLVDTADFPTAWKPIAEAHGAALAIYRAETDLEWTVVSPAANVAPGTRTGHYRAGADQLLTDGKGESHISAEDLAVAVVDELETPRHVRRRFSVVSA